MSVINVLRSGYSKAFFWKDLSASIAVVILLVPQALAYALLADFPPESGLYTALIALIIYPLFATSKQLSVGPVAMSSIILYAGLSAIPGILPEDYIRYGLIVTLMAGIIQILLGLFRIGVLVNFLSNPVISGFISAAAVIIIVNQLNVLLGIDIIRSNRPFIDLWNMITNIGTIQVITALFGILSIGIIRVAKRFNKRVPSTLVVFVLATLFSYIFNKFTNFSTPVIGEIPGKLPIPSFFEFTLMEVVKLFPLALVIAGISFIDSSALAKSLASSSQDHRVSPNKELYGLGFAKIVSSFFMGFPSSASFGRSAVNKAAGAKTQVSSWMAAVLIIIIMLFLTPLFFYAPRAMLAAIIITSVIKLIDIKKMKTLWKLDKRDFMALVGCFLVTLIIGIQEGILAGVVISLSLILWKNMKPHYAVLGKLHEQDVYRNIKRFEKADDFNDILILRFDDDLYFANSEHFYNCIMKEIVQNAGTKTLILDLSSIAHIDSTGFDTLHILSSNLKNKSIQLKFSGMKGPVRDLFERYGYDDIISRENSFMSINMAVHSCK